MGLGLKVPHLDLSKEVSKLKQEKLNLMNQKHESEMMLKEANEGLNEQKAEFELEKIKLKSELQAEHQEAIKQLEERMQRELAPKNTERMDWAVSTIFITYQRVITPVSCLNSEFSAGKG